MDSNEFSSKNLVKSSSSISIEDVFNEIADCLLLEKLITDKQIVVDNLFIREKEFSTGVGNKIAIPHATIKELTVPKIVILRLKKAIDWKAIEKLKVNLVIAILVPDKMREAHFDILTTLSSHLLDEEIINKFKKDKPEQLVEFINSSLFAKKEGNDNKEVKPTEDNKDQLKLVGVTTCATGIAHTFIAAEALEKEARARGWSVHIEKQGQMTKDQLKQEQIDEADYVIIAQSKGIDDPERFDGKMVFLVGVGEPITKAKEVLDRMLVEASIQGGKELNKSGVSSKTKTKKSLAEGPMRHLLTGISYMIPFIAMAGITLGFTTAFGFAQDFTFLGVTVNETMWNNISEITVDSTGINFTLTITSTEALNWLNNTFGSDYITYIQDGMGWTSWDEVGSAIYLSLDEYYGIDSADLESSYSVVQLFGSSVFGPKNDVANAVSTLAGSAFALYIPILGGYIAYSIAGRKAIAPAMILSFTLNIAPTLTTDASLVNLVTGGLAGPGASDGGASVFFNWSTLTFSGFSISPALGFLGAVAAGYLVGYAIFYFTKLTDKWDNRAFQTVLPLLIIPLVMTIGFYFLFAFIFYLPLWGIAIGLNALVTILIDNNLLWLAGAILGAMICFDLGGPVNKIAMVIGVGFISTNPEINGICAVAVSIPPMILFFCLVFEKITPLTMTPDNRATAGTAAVMGAFGITEGSIPFAAEEPKKWMPSFMIGGAVAGAIMAPIGVGNNVAMWGGPIIYFAGGYGNASDVQTLGFMPTDYGYAALYFIPLIIGGLVGFGIANGLEVLYNGLDKRKEAKKTLKNSNNDDLDNNLTDQELQTKKTIKETIS